MDEIDPDSVGFNNILEKVKEGKLTEVDGETLISNCSMCRMTMKEFRRRGFDDGGVFSLFFTNKDVKNYNDFQISNLQKTMVPL